MIERATIENEIDTREKANMSELLELHQLVDSEAEAHRIRRSKAYEMMQICYACPFLGILLATLSSFFFSLCSVIVKELVDINPIELASFRYVQMHKCLQNFNKMEKIGINI